MFNNIGEIHCHTFTCIMTYKLLLECI